MEMPLFPLRSVLFPGMMLPLHIFEARYREMINRCIEEELPFGVVLIKEGEEVGDGAVPHTVGTAARITRVERKPDGRMNIVVVGTRRFRIGEIHREHPYLTADVNHFPLLNGDTRLAVELAQRVRPKIGAYVDILSQASGIELQLERLPEDPMRLAFLVAMALQVDQESKQQILAQAGVPGMLELESYLLSRELQLLRYMLDSQSAVESLVLGPTGHLFAN